MEYDMELPSARPYGYKFRIESTALLIIDMQRDFLDPNGFGVQQCNNDEVFATVRSIVPRTKQVLDFARSVGIQVVYTREGHRPDLSDLPPSKKLRQVSSPSGNHTLGIGDQGPMGRLLVQGEYGHDIIDELMPWPGEVVVDKPGKGSFWNTGLHRSLLARGVTHLLIVGVTTECCVNTTFREAADRGFECCVLTDCTSGFDSSFVNKSLDMLCSYDGLFGFVSSSQDLFSQPIPARDISQGGDEASLSILRLQANYASGTSRPADTIRAVLAKINAYRQLDAAVWTHLKSEMELIETATALEDKYRGRPWPALYGIPFAVKDNIDVAGIPTTAAFTAYAYTPSANAPVVEALLNAGAIFIGKTNMDQLATGLSGTRSPHGIPRSVFSSQRISGGSSSGSAVAVGADLVSFALGTDTAGSGRVPAALNGVVGFKPTKGTISARGVVPACKSLDTVSVMAVTVEDARKVWLAIDEGPDASDTFSKPACTLPVWQADFRGTRHGGFKFGVPPESALSICDDHYRQAFSKAVERLIRTGGRPVDIDWAPFEKAGKLLYQGALLNERVQCIGPEFLSKHMSALVPALQTLFTAAMEGQTPAWQVYADQHTQAECTRQAAQTFETIDVLLVPTVPFHPTVSEMRDDPIALNRTLGEFTHFANVLDLCGIAIPSDVSEASEGSRLPFGVTLVGASGYDGKLFDMAREYERTN